jgi:hypothetical protein
VIQGANRGGHCLTLATVSARPRALDDRVRGAESTRPYELDSRFIQAVTQIVQLTLQELRTHDGPANGRRQRPNARRLYDVPSAAGQISISEAKAWALISEGRLRAVKVDGRTLIQAAELDRFAVDEVRPA